MDWSVLFQEKPPIPSHALLALAALGMGAVQLLLAKGTARHRVVGYVWVGLMAYVAISSFFIHEIRLWGIYSPIHLLSIVTLISLFVAIRAARNGNIQLHKQAMVALYFLGLVITGLFTLLPGRTMHSVVFAG